jgi:hypothetical protein
VSNEQLKAKAGIWIAELPKPFASINSKIATGFEHFLLQKLETNNLSLRN